MQKLKLDVDALQVESFAVLTAAGRAGTVHGRKDEGPFDLDYYDDSTKCDGAGWGSLFGTCEGCPTVGTCVGPTYCCKPTWRESCNGTCDTSCPGWECPI
jgi:hypothetical protein